MSLSSENRGLADYLAIVRRRWFLLLLVPMITVGATAASTLTQPKVYRSSMKIVVGQGEGIFLPEVGNVAEQFTQTMSNLLKSDVVAERAISDLGLNQSPDQLLAHLSVNTAPESAVLEVHYDNQDPRLSRVVLVAIGDVFTRLVDERLATGSRQAANTQVSATIFDPAHLLPDPVQPKPVRNLAVAVILGLLFGAVAAFARDALDDTVRNIGEAEQAFGQTATATLPPGLLGYRPFSVDAKKKIDPLVAELAFERLRARVLLTSQPGQVRSLLVTSADSEEGKSTVASNLAVLLANEGHSVIMVEADLRKPALQNYLTTWPKNGATSIDAVLRGNVSPIDALLEVPLIQPEGGLSLNGGRDPSRRPDGSLATGRLRAILTSRDQSWPAGRPWPAEFSLARTARVVEELTHHADYVIVDAPPILLVTDAYRFVGATDSVVAVVRNQKSSVSATRELAMTLGRLNAQRVQLVVTETELRFGGGYYGDRRPLSDRELKQEQQRIQR